MRLGLSNTKLSVSSIKRYNFSRIKKSAPSIAEKAIFIPKPKKRVKFKVNTRSTQAKIGHNENNRVVDGLASKIPVLGEHGLTASLGSAQHRGESAEGYVAIEIVQVAEKDFLFTPTQEEGRQINHHQIHFTQQYDAYGRPRIGFSREPYDFAATKYIQITSNLRFQENVSDTRENYQQYAVIDIHDMADIRLPGEDNGSADDPAKMGFGSKDSDEIDIDISGNNYVNQGDNIGVTKSLNTLGDKPIKPVGEEKEENKEDMYWFNKFFFQTNVMSEEKTNKDIKKIGNPEFDHLSITV